MIREMLALYLRGKGHATTGVGDGATGIERCRADRPGLVLCDLRMPGMGGLEVLEVLSRDYPDLPVIVVSGTGEMGDAIQALKLGAWDYVTKPIEDFAVLDHAVGTTLERARLLEENRGYRESLEAANARLARSLHQLEEDEAHGRRIQFALLPRRRMVFEGHECSWQLGTSTLLSGDFIDYFSIDPNHFGFYMADVSGHGVSSAMVTVLLKSYVGRYLENHLRYGDRTILEPAALLAALNQEVLAGQHGKYLTMFYGVVDLSDERLDYANGGQFPSPLVHDGGDTREIGGRSPPVGLMEEASYRGESLTMGAGFALRLFSDGVLELLDPPDLESRKARLRQVASDPDLDAAQLARELGMSGDRALPDDASILSIRRLKAND